MIDQAISPAAAEQARMDLSLAAGAAERANRPKSLLYFAIALLAIACIYTLSGVSARQSSMNRVAKARKASNEIIGLVNEVKRLQKSLAERGLEPNPHIGVHLENLAAASGATMTGAVTDSSINVTSVAGMTPRRYKAVFHSQDPGALLKFLNATIDAPETAGVGIHNLDLTPGAPDATGQVNWNMTVEFERQERQMKR